MPSPFDSHPRPSTSRGHRPLRCSVFVVATTAALLISGCGTGGDDADDAAATSTTAVDSTTTTEETTTTEDNETATTESPDAELTTADLEDLLPEASDIGPDYSEVTDDEEEDGDDSSEMDAAMERACPEASDFFRDDDEDDSDAAVRKFEASDDREIEVKLDPTPNPNFDEDVMPGLIEAVNSCTTIEVEQDGISMALDVEASADDTFGDRGVTIAMDAVMTHPQLPAPLELHYSSRAFIIGSVSVSLSAADGVAGESNDDVRVVPGDHDLLELLAEQFESGISDLQG